MQLAAIEREMRYKKEALKRCQYNVQCLKRAGNPEYEEAIWQFSNEAYLLEDQLFRYDIVFNLLKEDVQIYDDVPKRI
jgi:hypothetical protein